MPGSMPEGKRFIRDFLLHKRIERILDVGPGSGNYYDLLNCHGEYKNWGAPDKYLGVEWVGIEIFKPYVESFNLESKYSRIIISDIYDFNWQMKFDVVFLGDVLEHMSEDRGREVIKRAVEHSTWVVISLPIVEFLQGATYGNAHEAHVEQYTPERIKKILEDYHIEAFEEGDIIGVYILKGNYDRDKTVLYF